jgi:hypothetical protein
VFPPSSFEEVPAASTEEITEEAIIVPAARDREGLTATSKPTDRRFDCTYKNLYT